MEQGTLGKGRWESFNTSGTNLTMRLGELPWLLGRRLEQNAAPSLVSQVQGGYSRSALAEFNNHRTEPTFIRSYRRQFFAPDACPSILGAQDSLGI